MCSAASQKSSLSKREKVFREEGGLRALYRGIVATAAGVAPYVGINFAAYEALRGYITPPGKQSAWRKLACGALAGQFVSLFLFCLGVSSPAFLHL